MRELTATQRRVLEAIVSLTEAAGMPPTLREIGDAVGMKSKSTVSHHVQSLEVAGRVVRRHGPGRAICRGIRVASGAAE